MRLSKKTPAGFTSRQNNIKKLITCHARRLQKLKEQRALYGLSTDSRILIEIEDIKAEIEKLETELENSVEHIPRTSSITSSGVDGKIKRAESPKGKAVRTIKGIVIKYKDLSIEVSWIVVALAVLYFVIQSFG